jgi:hypothetical protein
MSLKSSVPIKKPLYFNELLVRLTGFEPITCDILANLIKYINNNDLASKSLKLKGYFIGAFPFCTELVLSTSQIIRSKIAIFQTQIVCNRLSLFWQLFQTTNMANRVERKKTIFYLYKYAITHI